MPIIGNLSDDNVAPPTNYQFVKYVGLGPALPTDANKIRCFHYLRLDEEWNLAKGFFTHSNTKEAGFLMEAKNKLFVVVTMTQYQGANQAGAIMTSRDVINDGAGGALAAGTEGTLETLANSQEQAGIGDTYTGSMTQGLGLGDGWNHQRARAASNTSLAYTTWMGVMSIGEFLWTQRGGASGTLNGEFGTSSSPHSVSILAMQVI